MSESTTPPTAANHWPDWVLVSGPNTASALGSISEAYGRILDTVSNGYLYEHVMQLQLNAVSDKLIEQGVINTKGQVLKQNVDLTHDYMAAQCYENGSAYRIIGVLCSTKKMAIVHLIDSVRSSLISGNLLVALICLRSLIEHIANFDAAVDKLRPYAVPASFEEANKALWEMKGKIVDATYATRVDWEGLILSETEDLIKRNKVSYKPVEDRHDRTANSILTAIDGLSKKVKGIRSVYEVLCEFAHPNVGLLLGLTRAAQPVPDKHGFYWVRKEFSLKAPLAVATESGDVLNQIFIKIAECMAHFETLLVEADQQRDKVQQISQIVLHQILTKQSDILDPYAPCPCGSNSKVKFCCGAATN